MPANCMMMLALIYGITPNAKMLARVNAPPVKMLSRSTKPPPPPAVALAKAALFTPGSTMKLPIRYTKSSPSVMRIRLRSSSMRQMFLIVSIRFFIVSV